MQAAGVALKRAAKSVADVIDNFRTYEIGRAIPSWKQPTARIHGLSNNQQICHARVRVEITDASCACLRACEGGNIAVIARVCAHVYVRVEILHQYAGRRGRAGVREGGNNRVQKRAARQGSAKGPVLLLACCTSRLTVLFVALEGSDIAQAKQQGSITTSQRDGLLSTRSFHSTWRLLVLSLRACFTLKS